MRPVKPVLTAFSDDLALPPADVGPVESWAFERLAVSWAEEMWGGVESITRSGSAW